MYATIIPDVNEHGQPLLCTQGTKVSVAPDSYLHGITGITLSASLNGMWSAVITCNVFVQPIKARIQLKLPRPARYYRVGGPAVHRRVRHV